MIGPANRVDSTEHFQMLCQRFGDAMERRRRRLGISQTELARRSGISMKYVGEIARGEANPSFRAMARLAGALEWDPFEERPIILNDDLLAILTTQIEAVMHMAKTAADGVEQIRAVVDSRLANWSRLSSNEPLELNASPRPRGRPRGARLPSTPARPTSE
jgi:transcriptional regulator with XRE-family HTH domain